MLVSIIRCFFFVIVSTIIVGAFISTVPTGVVAVPVGIALAIIVIGSQTNNVISSNNSNGRLALI